MEKEGNNPHSGSLNENFNRHGIRKQFQLMCAMMLALIVFVATVLVSIAYESMQNYHASAQALADVHNLNTGVSIWNAAIEDYMLDASDVNQEKCVSQWEQLDDQLQDLCECGFTEASQLILENICAMHLNGKTDMMILFSTDSNFTRLEYYNSLSTKLEGMLFLTNQLLQSNLEYEAQSYPVIVKQNLESMKLVLLILLISFLMVVVCSIRLVRAIYAPINLLVLNARQVEEGNYDTSDVEIINDDELGYMTHAFNDMKKAVCANFKNIKQIIELKDILQDVELRALQSQINPHFLFNVLTVAEEAALREQADQTVVIIENISYMLQYSLKCTKQDTTLQEELRTVRSYLFLQEKRFNERISFVFSAPAEIPVIQIPGMSLQPIVENAIKHGVEKMEAGGWVHVQVRERIGYIEVTVSDNGDGIEPDLLNAIRHQELDSAKSGIGLINTSRRMAMFYRQEGLFEIDSAPGKGTNVILRYPMHAKEDLHVQTVSGG